ncbi:hypothetical protein DL771_007098 [Monosporascus sp. 5C6A]|nr:hypothetical protein DL771_007098 [Monosporascus sp. 5C6A]
MIKYPAQKLTAVSEVRSLLGTPSMPSEIPKPHYWISLLLGANYGGGLFILRNRLSLVCPLLRWAPSFSKTTADTVRCVTQHQAIKLENIWKLVEMGWSHRTEDFFAAGAATSAQTLAPTLAPTQDTQRSAGPFTSTPGTLSIFSWNVNGIAPFVQDYVQKPISAFFKPSSAAGKKRRRGATDDDVTTDSEDDGVIEAAETGDPVKEGKASLRAALLRYRWPHILFLQEVKIKVGDAKTMAAVRVAVNDAGGSTRSDRMRNARGHVDGTEIREKGTVAAWLEDGGPEYDVQFNLPADPRNAKGFGGKVYGVAAIIRKDFMHRYVQSVREVAWDREGRVQIIETGEVTFPLDPDPEAIPTSAAEKELSDKTRQKDDAEFAAKFAIINIYAVNGTSNPYYNTQTGVEVGTRHDRKLAVHTELLREAHALQRKGFQVIIAGDLNVARNELDGYPNLRTWPHQHVLNRLDFNTKFFTKQPIKHISSRASYSKDAAASIEESIQGFDACYSSTARASVEGRNAIVTGSSRGIGKAIATRLASDGYNVCINDIPANQKGCEEVVSEIQALGRQACVAIADVSKRDEVKQMVQTSVDVFGSLDTMIANAGIAQAKAVLDLTEAEFERMFAVNVFGVNNCYAEAAKQMIAQGTCRPDRPGKIIGAASIVAFKPLPLLPHYSAAKWAVRGLTQAYAMELAKHNITVNAYAPGIVGTPMWDQIDAQIAEKRGVRRGDIFKQFVREYTALGRASVPEDVAKLVSFLAGSDSDFYKIHHITSTSELQALFSSTTYVAVDFYADWCPPCKSIAPVFSALASQHSVPGVLAFAKVNVDHAQDVARTYRVTAMPTFLFFKEGRQVAVNGQVAIQGADPRSLGAAAEKLGGLAKKRVEAKATEGKA